ncbi:PIG-L deacetylase family protein [Oceanobacillus alkalisoli]|uniref:PIG-L deacetylase family protein n=1 Tax=Oceanobacillus alkalisoli TaxID=2925113 RepID=UPI001EF082FF|nr:PIG-L family deacetylase [Oceanobacillus alkalisoli]MCF3942681.1 PIG-L family deacetylase [Oceanobacillus alkalisoli]MCG5102653.1 PIG-L family deacetylase [Oceanobacillus alkalisoli]
MDRRKYLTAGVIVLVSAIVLAIFFRFDILHKDLNEVIYYIPHQDDEVITFGVSIHDHVEKGHDVHVVLLTDGANSAVRHQLDLTKEEFSEARNREFDLAVEILGVDADHVEKLGHADGDLQVEDVEEVIREYQERYPDASHKTFSYHDPHHDHANAGHALRNLMKEGIIEDGTFYFGNNFTPLDVEIKEDHYEEDYLETIIEASRAYKEVDMDKGMYGIGWKSVPEYFITLEENPVSPYHELE